MSTPQLQDNINWLLIRSSMTVKQGLMKMADKYDLSLMQALTLCILEPGKPVAMSLISDTFTCDPSNVTGIVERLSVGKYIERRESPLDRRVKTISLTKAGNELRLKLLDKIAASDAASMAQLSENEIATLKSLLLKAQPAPKHAAKK